MRALTNTAELAHVTGDIERAAEIQRRLEALGITDREFQARTGVDRKALRRAADGEHVRGTTYTAVEAWLDKLEHEVGMDLPSAPSDLPGEGLVTFSVSGNFGVSVTVAGPVANMAELQASVDRIVEKMQQENRDQP